MIKNPPANEGELRGASSTLGWAVPLEEGVASHSRILIWRIPWTEKPGRTGSLVCRSPWGHTESDTTEAT